MRSLLLIVLLFGLYGCGAPDAGEKAGETAGGSGKVTVATAANVQFAMEELGRLFKEQTGHDLEIILSSSGKLTAQIQQGAPYDLLVSANMKYPQYLFDNDLAATEPRVYAYGALVLWTAKDMSLDRPLPDLLQDPQQVQKIALANPKNAPYGVETIKALGHFGILEAVRDRLVYGESIAQANQYIITGACEMGFTAQSVVLSPEIQEQGRWVEVPPEAYDPIAQGVVITRHGAQHNGTVSRQFYDFLFSEEAQAVLERYGYTLPGKG